MEGYRQDAWAKSLIAVLRDDEPLEDQKLRIQLPYCTFEDGFVYRIGSNDTR